MQQLLSVAENVIEPIAQTTIDPNIIVAIIAGLVTVITLVYSKWKEVRIQQRNTKEQKYVTFLSSLILAKTGDTKAFHDFNEVMQVINLVGSPRVVEKANAFLSFFTQKHTEDAQTIQKMQGICYCELIKAMRRDLYGWRSNLRFPKMISLTILEAGNGNVSPTLDEITRVLMKK